MKSLVVLLACLSFMFLSTPLLADWEFSTIGSAGGYPNLALDSQGQKHIAYQNDANENLMYGYWDGNDWQIEIVDSGGVMGRSADLVLDENDHPHIAYYEDLGDFAGHLKYARFDGSTWHLETVDSSVDCGQDCAIDIDSLGYPHISYVDNQEVDLRYARFDGTSWHLETVDSEFYVGLYGDMVLDSEDHAHICHRNNTTGDLRYAEWDGSMWHLETVDSEGSVGAFTSILLDSEENVHISYYDWPDNLKYAKKTGDEWAIETIDTGGRYTSMALDSNGYPCISHGYYISWNSHTFKYAQWNGEAWILETLESGGVTGTGTALVIDEDDTPHIVYKNGSQGILKYAFNTFVVSVEPGDFDDPDEMVNAPASRVQLWQNTPNPFNPVTTIQFDLPQAGSVNLSVFDVTGKVVRRLISGQSFEHGTHQVSWDGNDDSGIAAAAGVYLYQIETHDSLETKRMVLVK